MRNEIKTSFDKRDVIVLIDRKNEKKFVFQTFIKNVDIFEFEYILIVIRVIDDHKIYELLITKCTLFASSLNLRFWSMNDKAD